LSGKLVNRASLYFDLPCGVVEDGDDARELLRQVHGDADQEREAQVLGAQQLQHVHVVLLGLGLALDDVQLVVHVVHAAQAHQRAPTVRVAVLLQQQESEG